MQILREAVLCLVGITVTYEEQIPLKNWNSGFHKRPLESKTALGHIIAQMSVIRTKRPLAC